MLIGISGHIGSGKDTVGEIIQKLCITNNKPNFEIKKFAGKLKEIASLLTGIDVEKFEDQEFKKTLLGPEWGTVSDDPLNSIPVFEDVQFNHLMSVRELLQKLGTEAMRNGLHENVWVNALFADYKTAGEKLGFNSYSDRDIKEGFAEKPKWCITDMRFPNELKAVEDRDGITIRIERGDSTNTLGNLHPSETALDDATFDYVIYNNGTMEELVNKVREILIDENILIDNRKLTD